MGSRRAAKRRRRLLRSGGSSLPFRRRAAGNLAVPEIGGSDCLDRREM